MFFSIFFPERWIIIRNCADRQLLSPLKEWITFNKFLVSHQRHKVENGIICSISFNKTYCSFISQIFMKQFSHQQFQDTEAKRKFATHSDLSDEIMDPKTLKPWSDTWLKLFEILQQLPIKSLFQNFKLRQVPVTGSHTRKFDLSIMSFLVTPSYYPIFKKFSR